MRGSRRGRGAASSRRWHWQRQPIWRGCSCTRASSGQGCRSWGRRRRQQRPRGGRLSWRVMTPGGSACCGLRSCSCSVMWAAPVSATWRWGILKSGSTGTSGGGGGGSSASRRRLPSVRRRSGRWGAPGSSCRWQRGRRWQRRWRGCCARRSTRSRCCGLPKGAKVHPHTPEAVWKQLAAILW
jgi:hypothetical protein